MSLIKLIDSMHPISENVFIFVSIRKIICFHPNERCNPNFRNVGTFFYIWMKWKLKNFEITWANILFTIEHREHNKYLNREILHFYPINEIHQIWRLLPVSKKLARGQQRAEKARHFEKIQLGEHLETNWGNWHQVCNMLSYKRDVLVRQSLSEVKMSRGSPICERVCKKIVEYFKNNVLQRQITKALQISTSSVQNIVINSEKIEKSLCVRDKAEHPLLDARGPQMTLHHSLAWLCH